MVDKYHQTIHGGVTKHDPQKLAQTKGLAREFGDLVNDYDDRDGIYERRRELMPASGRGETHRRQEQRLHTRIRGPARDFSNTFRAPRRVPLCAVQLNVSLTNSSYIVKWGETCLQQRCYGLLRRQEQCRSPLSKGVLPEAFD